MRFSDLQCLFDPVVTELICDDTRQFEIGDLVKIKKQNDSDNAYISPVSGLISSLGKFATPSYAEAWTGIQDSPYFAVVAQINGRRMTVSAVTGFFLRELDRSLEIAITDAAISSTNPEYRDYGTARAYIESEYTVTLAK